MKTKQSLVERLRGDSSQCGPWKVSKMRSEAADRIEELEALLKPKPYICRDCVPPVGKDFHPCKDCPLWKDCV